MNVPKKTTIPLTILIIIPTPHALHNIIVFLDCHYLI